jgi:hypothetical protein
MKLFSPVTTELCNSNEIEKNITAREILLLFILRVILKVK